MICHTSDWRIPESMSVPLLVRIDRLRDELWGDAEDHRPDLRAVATANR